MKERLEIRVSEDKAGDAFLQSLFQPGELTRLVNDITGSVIWVGKVVNPEPGRLDELSALGQVATAAALERDYSEAELAKAELLTIRFAKQSSVLHDNTIDCYDLSRCCPQCGFGLQQVRDVCFRPGAVRNKSGVRYVKGIGEVLVEHSRARSLEGNGLSGFQFRPVKQGPLLRYEDVPSGRLLLQYAREKGGGSPESCYSECEDAKVKQHLKKLFSQSHAEAAASPKFKPQSEWVQLLPTGKPVSLLADQMRFGQMPWTRNRARESETRRHYSKRAFRFVIEPSPEPSCGHVAGWDVQSETVVSRKSWDGSDFCVSQQVHVWNEGGFYGYYPRPVLLATPRFCRTFGPLKEGPFWLEAVKLV